MSLLLVKAEIDAYKVLLDALAVHEILKPEPDMFSSDGKQLAWRDEVLAVIDMGQLLQARQRVHVSLCMAMVYSSMPGQKIALLFDRVTGISGSSDRAAAMQVLPPCGLLPDTLYQVFDGVFTEMTASGQQFYHMRRPFDLLGFHQRCMGEGFFPARP